MIGVPLFAGLVVFGLMLIEAAIAAINERALRAQGAVEPPGDVFGAMQFAYPAAFLWSRPRRRGSSAARSRSPVTFRDFSQETRRPGSFENIFSPDLLIS